MPVQPRPQGTAAPPEATAATTPGTAPARRAHLPLSPARVAGGTLAAVAAGVRLGAIAAGVLLAVAILLVELHANPHNSIVAGIRDAAQWLTQPWHDMFTPHSVVSGEVANRAVAAAVYFIGGLWLSRLLGRLVGRVRR